MPPGPDSTLRWGILSTAKIAREYLIPAINAVPGCEVTAVASRDGGRAEAFAREHGIAHHHPGYRELVDDPHIDVIYNPLPNNLHAHWTREAAAAGKHVLSEKPFTMDLAEARQLAADLASMPDARVMEAFMYQFHPQWESVFDMVSRGRIGRVVAVQTWFSYYGDDPGNIRNIPETGGGALMDIGCYAIHSARRLFAAEPIRVRGSLDIHPDFGVDVTASALLDFPGGGQATFTVSTLSDADQRVTVVGTEGRIEITRPFNANPTRPMVVRVGAGMGELYDEPLDELRFGPVDQYSVMVRRFVSTIAAGEPAPIGIDDAVATMAVVDEIRRSHDDDRG